MPLSFSTHSMAGRQLNRLIDDGHNDEEDDDDGEDMVADEVIDDDEEVDEGLN